MPFDGFVYMLQMNCCLQFSFQLSKEDKSAFLLVNYYIYNLLDSLVDSSYYTN